MKLRVLILTAAAVLIPASGALAQASGAGGAGSSSTSAGGSSASGTSSSSASISSHGANVGVVQGNVAGGSSTSGSNNAGDSNSNGSSSSGSSGSGGVVGTSDAPNALTDGALNQLHLPAMGTAKNATPASSSSHTPAPLWALAGAVVLGLAVLYRRLPRPSRA